jgi:AraC family transcriptional regulator, transcriptional activator of pobA
LFATFRIMKRTAALNDTPLYCLDAFGERAEQSLFYIETLQEHLQKHPFVSKSHRHDFYLGLYISQGSGTHTIDFVDYPVKSNAFYLMTPGQVHAWNLAPDTDGYFFFFVPAFYQMGQQEADLTAFPFFQSFHPSPYIQLPGCDTVINMIIREMLKEYKTSTPDAPLLRSYLEVVLRKLTRERDVPIGGDATPNATHKLRRLEELINRHYRELKQPHEYAELMNLSASYLNNVCKTVVGKTLSDLINERVVLEAKRFFSYADLTISQVAAKLNFADPSYFIRFFKKHTGQTPEQFREQINRPL